MMGFAWGTGGLSVPFVGMIADRAGIEPTLAGLAFMPLVAALLAIPLPAHAPSRSADAARASLCLRPEAEVAVVR